MNPNDPLDGTRLELTFPCSWTYTVIAEDEGRLELAVAAIVVDLQRSLRFSNESRGGRYRSYQLEVVVPSDEERLRIFRELYGHEHVRYVL